MQQRRSKRARRNPSPRMFKVTVHEKQRVNEEQPTPASSPSRKSQQGNQTTSRSSALVLSQSTKFMARPSRELQSRCSEIGSHFHHFPAVYVVRSGGVPEAATDIDSVRQFKWSHVQVEGIQREIWGSRCVVKTYSSADSRLRSE